MTRSNRSPAAAQAGSISAALPTSAMLSGLAVAAASRAQASASAGSAGQPVDVADVEPAPRPRLVDLDDDADALVHGHRQRLRAAHPAETGRQGDRPAQRAAEMLAGRLGERLVGALQDALRPDVDPRAGGHLAVHHQALPLELAEDLPGRPLADEVRVGDEDPRRPRMRPDDPDRLARLDEQGLVALEPAELADDGVERLPRPRRAAGPAVDDEVVGVLGDLRVEVVHEHPEGRFLLPAAAAQLAPARRADGACADGAHGLGHRGGRLPPRPGHDEAADGRRRPGTSRSGELAAHDREALVGDRLGEPDRFPEAGRRGTRRVRSRADLRVGLDRGEAAAGQVVADRADQRAGQAGAACLGRRRDAGDDRGERRVRERRIEVARPLRARVRGQRPELRVGLGDVVLEQDLGVAPGDPQAAAEQLELARRLGPDGRPLDRWRRERVVDRAVVVLARGQERVGRSGGRERVGGRRLGLEIGEERVRRAAAWAIVGRRTRLPTAPATTAAPPSTRGRRPPSSRTSDGRTPDPRRAGCGRRWPRR